MNLQCIVTPQNWLQVKIHEIRTVNLQPASRMHSFGPALNALEINSWTLKSGSPLFIFRSGHTHHVFTVQCEYYIQHILGPTLWLRSILLDETFINELRFPPQKATETLVSIQYSVPWHVATALQYPLTGYVTSLGNFFVINTLNLQINHHQTTTLSLDVLSVLHQIYHWQVFSKCK